METKNRLLFTNTSLELTSQIDFHIIVDMGNGYLQHWCPFSVQEHSTQFYRYILYSLESWEKKVEITVYKTFQMHACLLANCNSELIVVSFRVM